MKFVTQVKKRRVDRKCVSLHGYRSPRSSKTQYDWIENRAANLIASEQKREDGEGVWSMQAS